MAKIKSLSDTQIDKLTEQVSVLERDVYRLQMEKDILEKATDIIKKIQASV